MARNGSGTYSVPNTFIAGNTITAAGHNQNWSDLVAEMTNSVAADGQTPITAGLKGANGTAALPSYSFNSDLNTGAYRHGADEYGFSTGGVAAGYFDSAQKFWMLGAADIAGLLNVTGVATFASTSHMALPSGNTAARPGSPAAGMFRYNSQTANPEFYSTAWIALLSSLSGAQMPYGAVINGTIAESNGTNAVTFALKTLAGADPTAGDPVLLAFRNATVGTGNYVYRTVTAALSLTISSGSTMGFTSATAGKLWLTLFDDAGTIRMGAINCLSGSNIYPLGQMPLASSTAEGGAGAADSAQVFYTGVAVTSKPYLVLGYASYETGIATAGSWNASPTRLQLYGAGVPLPGSIIQSARTDDGAVHTGTTTIPGDDTIPQSGEGDQYLTQAITPTSATSLLKVSYSMTLTNSAAAIQASAIFRDSGADALAATETQIATNARPVQLNGSASQFAGSSSATTFKVRSGGTSAGATTVNGAAAARVFGGVMNSFIEASEIMT